MPFVAHQTRFPAGALTRALGVATILLLVAAGGTAQTLVYEHEEEPLFSMEVPEGWIVDLDFAQEAREAGALEGEEPRFRIVEVSPGDGSHVWFGIWSLPDIGTMDEGIDYLSALQPDLFTDVEVSAPKAATLNGMSARSIKGTAVHDGQPVEVAMALFEARAGTLVVALYVGEKDAWQTHRDELESMVQSLEPVAP